GPLRTALRGLLLGLSTSRTDPAPAARQSARPLTASRAAARALVAALPARGRDRHDHRLLPAASRRARPPPPGAELGPVRPRAGPGGRPAPEAGRPRPP